MPGLLGNILTRLEPTMGRLTGQFGTDDFFVLRHAAPVSDQRGGTRKSYEATTEEALRCFCTVIQAHGGELEKIVAARKVPVVIRRFVCAATVDVNTQDRLKLVARGEVPEITDMEVVRAVPLSGVLMEVIAIEERKAVAA
jgi:hypothetical protein